MTIKIKLLPGAELPMYKTSQSAGCDLRNNGPARRLLPGDRAKFPTGVCIQLPDGYEAQVRGRSGLNFNNGITCPVGTIDADYRGEIGVCLYNQGDCEYTIQPGESIAQLVIKKVERAEWDEVEDLEMNTERGVKGFGSTGKF